jgi:hypothetical protein
VAIKAEFAAVARAQRTIAQLSQFECQKVPKSAKKCALVQSRRCPGAPSKLHHGNRNFRFEFLPNTVPFGAIQCRRRTLSIGISPKSGALWCGLVRFSALWCGRPLNWELHKLNNNENEKIVQKCTEKFIFRATQLVGSLRFSVCNIFGFRFSIQTLGAVKKVASIFR